MALALLTSACGSAHPAAAPAGSAPEADAATALSAPAASADLDARRASSAEDAPADIVPRGVVVVSAYGYVTAGSLPLGSTLRVYEVACSGNEVKKTWRCRPAKGLFEAMEKQGSVGGLSFDARRTSACFSVDRRAADAKLVEAIARIYDANGDADRRARGESALHAHDPGVPSLVVVQVRMHHAGAVCRCQGLDCCLGRRFTPAEVQAGYDTSEISARASQTISVPTTGPAPLGTVALYDVTPHAADVVALAQRQDWKGATALAARELEHPDKLAPRKRSLAWSNLAAVAFQARDKESIARAAEAVAAMGDAAHPYAKSIIARLGPGASGGVWLDGDACAAARAPR